MSEQTKIYAPARKCEEKTFSTGKTVLKLQFKAEELIEFAKKHANSRGYLNLGISRRRQVGEYGDTHCCWLDTWEPRQDAGSSGGRQDTSPTPKTQPRPVSAPAKAIPAGGIDDADVPTADDVPF